MVCEAKILSKEILITFERRRFFQRGEEKKSRMERECVYKN